MNLRMVVTAIVFTILTVMLISCAGPSTGPAPKWIVSERLVAQIEYSSWIPDSMITSPDNRRVAYLTQAGDKHCVVVDGQVGKQYDGIVHLTFSPNSQWTAYTARLGDKHFVVVDGQEGRQYAIGEPIFSPDSQRVAYVAGVSNKQFVVADGKEGKQYDEIWLPPIFSPDSKQLAYAVRVGDSQFVVVDGKEGKQYDNILGEGGKIIFDSSDSLHYLALKGNSTNSNSSTNSNGSTNSNESTSTDFARGGCGIG